MQIYVQSALLLAGFTGLGYILLKLTTPTEYKLPTLRQSTHYTSEQKREARLFMERMQEKTKDT